MNSLVARWLAIVVGVVIVAVAIGLYVNKLVRAPTPVSAQQTGPAQAQLKAVPDAVNQQTIDALFVLPIGWAHFPVKLDGAFANAGYAGITSLGLECSVTSKIGSVHDCVWTFAGEAHAVDGTNATIATSQPFPGVGGARRGGHVDLAPVAGAVRHAALTSLQYCAYTSRREIQDSGWDKGGESAASRLSRFSAFTTPGGRLLRSTDVFA